MRIDFFIVHSHLSLSHSSHPHTLSLITPSHPHTLTPSHPHTVPDLPHSSLLPQLFPHPALNPLGEEARLHPAQGGRDPPAGGDRGPDQELQIDEAPRSPAEQVRRRWSQGSAGEEGSSGDSQSQCSCTSHVCMYIIAHSVGSFKM